MPRIRSSEDQLHQDKIAAFRRLRPVLDGILTDEYFDNLRPYPMLQLPTANISPATQRTFRSSADLDFLAPFHHVGFASQADIMANNCGDRVFDSPYQRDRVSTYRLMLALAEFKRITHLVLNNNGRTLQERSVPAQGDLSYTFGKTLKYFITDSLTTLSTIFESLHYYAPDRQSFLQAAHQVVTPQERFHSRSLMDLLSTAPEAFWGSCQGFVVSWYDYEKQEIDQDFFNGLNSLKKMDPSRNHGGCPVGVPSPREPMASVVTRFAQKFVEFLDHYFSAQYEDESMLLQIEDTGNGGRH